MSKASQKSYLQYRVGLWKTSSGWWGEAILSVRGLPGGVSTLPIHCTTRQAHRTRKGAYTEVIRSIEKARHAYGAS